MKSAELPSQRGHFQPGCIQDAGPRNAGSLWVRQCSSGCRADLLQNSMCRVDAHADGKGETDLPQMLVEVILTMTSSGSAGSSPAVS